MNSITPKREFSEVSNRPAKLAAPACGLLLLLDAPGSVYLSYNGLRVIGACRHPNPAFFRFIGAWEAVIGLKLTRREGCAGLRQASLDFPDLQKVESLILVILDLNCFIFIVFLRNSSFSGSVGLI